jgi:hypothetical protein
MKKTTAFLSGGKVLVFVLLTGLCLFLSAQSATAQQTAQGNLNPYTHIASKLDVTAYNLGSFERTHTLEVLEQILAGLKPLLSNGGGSELQRLKYEYVNKVVADVATQYVAVEISLLTSLSGMLSDDSSIGTDSSELRALYNEVVNQID